MPTSKTVLRTELREKYLSVLSEKLASNGEEVLIVGSNEIALPVVDSEGNDEFVVITVKVPTGSRDGESYDGYSMAQDYAMKCAEKAEKAKAKAEAKARKMAQDQASREAKAKAKKEG